MEKQKTKREAIEKPAENSEIAVTVEEKKEVKKVEKTAPKVEKKDSLIKYQKVIASCACGAEYETGSTLNTIRVDICANCHPFFTGEKKILDSEGRVEKFRKKYKTAEKTVAKSAK